ncbi:sulfatase [Tamlana sp. I1]|uniref:sulfatase family protein n=1 Tax=Tamlana sp. I1 TaxID=2762061 RepID=UPI00188F43D5|nr:sulfatase [Tamlana sp. I1]
MKGKPNILLVLADDWSFPHATIYGDSVVNTPNFDLIAKSGILFNNAFCSAPSCTPSRAAILTGRYPHALNEGANLWGTLPNSYTNYVSELESAGYVIGYQDKGWGPGNYEDGGYTHNPAGKLIENFDSFFEKLDGSKPFCFWYGTRDPHRPYTKGLGEASGLDIDDAVLPDFYPDDSELKSDLLDYYYEVQRIDYDLARILFRLERKNMLENTLIVVTSDNGMPFPRAKANCYDLGTRVPLAIAWGDQIKNKGSLENTFVNLLDLAPTFLDIAGLDIPKEMQGKSLLPLLKGETTQHKDKVFLERERHAFVRKDNTSYPMRAVRDSNYLLIHNLYPERWPAGDPIPTDLNKGFGDIDASPSKNIMISKKDTDKNYRTFFDISTEKRPEFEFYDIIKDPYQTNNLVNSESYQSKILDYKKVLMDWRQNTEDGSLNHLGNDYPFDNYKYYGKYNTLLDE